MQLIFFIQYGSRLLDFVYLNLKFTKAIRNVSHLRFIFFCYTESAIHDNYKNLNKLFDHYMLKCLIVLTFKI